MNKKEELEMWWRVFVSLRGVPNDCRSQNHTALINEVATKIYDLIDDDPNLRQRDWNTKNREYLPLVKPLRKCHKPFYCHDEDIGGKDRCQYQCKGCIEWGLQ